MVRIPSEYQEVEYIESTGTQWIDLPFGFDPTDEIETKFSIATSQSNDKYIVSPNRWNDNANRFALGVHMGGLYTAGFGDNNTGTTILLPNTSNDGKIHEWIYNNYVFSISDVLASKDVSNITFKATTTNLRLFYGYNANTKGKIASYNHKKANGTEINLIPCYRKSDNEIGMYDTVTGTFFTNQGTGTFLKGNDVTYDTVNLMESRRRILLNTPHLESLSGSTLSFKTDIASKLKECKIHFTPVQEGSGDPSPDNVRPIHGWDGVTVNACGKNLFDKTSHTITLGRGINYLTGGLSGLTSSTRGYTDYIAIKGGQPYTLSCITISMGAGSTWGLAFYDSEKVYISGIANAGSTSKVKPFISPDNASFFRATFTGITSAEDAINEIQLEFGSEATDYEPYNATTLTIPFPQTIYGGYVDLVNGEVVEEIDSEGQQITPNIYSITPQTIRTLKGLNNIFSDANGNIEIKYWTH